jgi:hypothetical protein
VLYINDIIYVLAHLFGCGSSFVSVVGGVIVQTGRSCLAWLVATILLLSKISEDIGTVAEATKVLSIESLQLLTRKDRFNYVVTVTEAAKKLYRLKRYRCRGETKNVWFTL